MTTRLAEQHDQMTVEVALDADDPLVRLRGLKVADQAVERWLAQAVGDARRAGVSWAAIGEALNVSRHGAWKLYNAKLLDATTASQERSGLTEEEAMDLAVSELRAMRTERGKRAAS
ncbi:MAG: hypothetical protein ACYDEY_11120 [Acidimicrobiales bacterium]